MSSCDCINLEERLEHECFHYIKEEKRDVKKIIHLFEWCRERVEAQIENFNEEECGWRSYGRGFYAFSEEDEKILDECIEKAKAIILVN